MQIMWATHFLNERAIIIYSSDSISILKKLIKLNITDGIAL